MAFFVHFKNFDGSATEEKHKGWARFNTLEFSVRNHHKVRPGHTDDRNNTIPHIIDVVLTKPLDKASPKLFEASCGAKVNKEVIIHVGTGETNTPICKSRYTMLCSINIRWWAMMTIAHRC